MKKGYMGIARSETIADEVDAIIRRGDRPYGAGVGLTAGVKHPNLRYTLPDFDRTWRGKVMQMIVDHLHKNGD